MRMRQVRLLSNTEYLLCARHHPKYFINNISSIPPNKEGTIIIAFLWISKLRLKGVKKWPKVT